MVEAFGGEATLLSVTADTHRKANGLPVNECVILDALTRTMETPWQPVDKVVRHGSEVEVYTDGTYSCSGTMEQWAQGMQSELAAAGVYIVSDQEEVGYRITSVDMKSAYDAETVAIAAAGHLAPGAVIYTDCKAVQEAANKDQHRTGIAHIMRVALNRGEIKKVRAHAERRKHKRDWTREEEGNCKADAIAGGRIHELNIREDQVDMEQAIYRALPLVWKDLSGRITFEPNNQRCNRYAKARDDWRRKAEDVRLPRWEGTTNRLGAAMWKKQECSWAQAVRIMWDKNVTGENEKKWKCKDATKCEVCGVLTSQRHMILECQRPGAEAIRARAISKVRREGDKHGNTLVGKTIRVILGIGNHEEAHTIWTGMWSPSIRQMVRERCPWTLTRREYSSMVAALRHLAEGVLELYKQGGARGVKRMRECASSREPRQTAMEEYLVRRREMSGEAGGMEKMEQDAGLEEMEGNEMRETDERVHDSRKYDR
jgi:hypothetical protein